MRIKIGDIVRLRVADPKKEYKIVRQLINWTEETFKVAKIDSLQYINLTRVVT